MESLSDNQIRNYITDLEDWNFGKDKISKKFEFRDFKDALAFIIKVGIEAEKSNHHPEIINIYNQVTIALQTHDVGNKVSIKDIDLARNIEKIVS